MTHRMKLTFTALAGAALLAGCATGPYYDNYGYGSGYDYPYGPGYYGSPVYVAPSVGFGLSYSDRDRGDWRDNRREWRGDRDGDGRREWRGDRDGDGNRDGRGRGDWRNDHGQRSGG